MEPLTTGPSPPEPRPPGRAGSRLWIGLLLMGLGALFALAAYGVVDVHPLWRLWPLVMIFFGLRLTLRCRGRHAGGFVLLFLGAWFLARSFDLVPLDDRLFTASILVIVGLSLALSAILPPGPGGRRSGDRRGAPAAGAGSRVHSTAVLGAVTQASAAADFRGGSAGAFLGSCEIDLRQAAIGGGSGGLGGEAVLEANAFWGGVRIYVPESWTVEVEGSALLGAFHNAARRPADASQRLVVTGLAVMGGVEVRNEREARP
jgi:hypothetical protein